MRPTSYSLSLFVVLAGVSCAGDADLVDEESDCFTCNGKADQIGISEGSCDALAVQEFAGTATFEVLDDDVRLDSRAARGIFEHGEFRSLAELDAVPFVGPVAFARIVTYADDNGFIDCETADPLGGELFQVSYGKSPQNDVQDWFGYSVAANGDTMVVGAPFEASAATGVNGDMASNSNPKAGAAYVYVKNGGEWEFQAYLKASFVDSSEDESFGDGDGFGTHVAIDGDTIVVGAPSEDSNATGVNGDPTDISADRAGAAYVFVREGATWQQQAYLKGPTTGDQFEFFGQGVSVSGDLVAVQRARESVHLFERDGTNWSELQVILAPELGIIDSVALGGDVLAVGEPEKDHGELIVSGSVQIYERGQDSQFRKGPLLESSIPEDVARLGADVAISRDGNTVVAGAPGGFNIDFGTVSVFERANGTWSETARFAPQGVGLGDEFGQFLAIRGDIIAVGSYNENAPPNTLNGGEGAAYVFARIGGEWRQSAHLKASNAEADDNFGRVAISGDSVIVSAPRESGSASGMNTDGQQNNGSHQSGAIYIFE